VYYVELFANVELSSTFQLGLLVSRFFNIYPLSFLLNLGRRRKVSAKFQHMMFFAGKLLFT
jgi:hypothetical protein